jgi:predicted RNase H-like HicB family nuclease
VERRDVIKSPETEVTQMRQYIALIHKEADSDYGVSFPDFPGCVTAGADLDAARGMAEEALAFHVDGLTEDGEALPEPSSLESVMSDPDNRDGVAILVALADGPAKTVRVNITLPEDALREIDAYAEAQGFTRSGFLLKAARGVLAGA